MLRQVRRGPRPGSGPRARECGGAGSGARAEAWAEAWGGSVRAPGVRDGEMGGFCCPRPAGPGAVLPSALGTRNAAGTAGKRPCSDSQSGEAREDGAG